MNFVTALFDLLSPFSVEKITRRHERDIARLQKVSDNRRALAESTVTVAHDLLADARDHAEHAAKAERIAERMKALLD